MIVVSSREFRSNQKKFFDLAEEQRVFIKRRNRFMELVPCGETIPDVSPSNDPYFNNRANIEAIERSSRQAAQGRTVILTKELREELFR